MTNDKPCLQVKDLVVRYSTELILNDISFSVNSGEIFVILGGSGSGKTTLMRHMIGLDQPAAGQVKIEDTDIAAVDEARFFQTLQNIGVLFQNSALVGSMTIGENVALPITEYTAIPRRLIPVIVRMKLSLVNLACYENYLPSELSGGMKKRAGLARALALNPDILFLDEPSAGLDPVTAGEIDELIRHINQTLGTTIIIVTHDLDSIFALAQRAIMLDKSTKGIIAEGTPRHLREQHENPVVRRFFSRATASGTPDQIP